MAKDPHIADLYTREGRTSVPKRGEIRIAITTAGASGRGGYFHVRANDCTAGAFGTRAYRFASFVQRSRRQTCVYGMYAATLSPLFIFHRNVRRRDANAHVARASRIEFDAAATFGLEFFSPSPPPSRGFSCRFTARKFPG